MSGYIIRAELAPVEVVSVPAFKNIRVQFGDLSLHLTHDDAETLHNKLTRALVELEEPCN